MKELVDVTILIPARNEELNLKRLFESLDQLDYPTEKLQVLLGNDNSEDQSGVMMDQYAKDRPCVKVVHLKTDPNSSLKGKTRVLNELIKKSTGEYLFFTDADISLPPSWIKGMLAEFDSKTGVVVGATGYQKSSLWSILQGIEWMMALSIFKLAADFGISSTGLGNNMTVSKKAYDVIGGYDTIGFSIVEDFHLYDQIIKAGFRYKHSFKPEILAYTVPPENYLEQRKRWIKGAMSARPWAMLPAILQAFFFPILILIAFYSTKTALIIFASIFMIYAILILFFERKLKIKGYFKYLIPFSGYISIAWLVQFVYFFIKKDTVWKGRSY